jgi:hypothetical protein
MFTSKVAMFTLILQKPRVLQSIVINIPLDMHQVLFSESSPKEKSSHG